nr:retron system putative HNH endonuclease [uncultured Carboxylicivirga sp.]
MKHITKGSEPPTLTQFKRDGGTKYEGQGLDKSEIQQQLLLEQKGLCAYCLCRIHAVEGGLPQMGIEHIKCRKNHPDLQLDYKNMLGVCKGGEGNPKQNAHCDKSKDVGDYHYEIKKLNPLNTNIETLIKFLDNGKIISTHDDADVEADIRALNLNEYYTQINRESIITKLKEDYKRARLTKNIAHVEEFKRKQLSKWERQVNKQGYLQPYNLVAIKYLHKISK